MQATRGPRVTRRTVAAGAAMLAGLAAPAAVGALAACGTSASGGAGSAGAPSKGPATIEIMQDPQSPLIQEHWPKIWKTFEAGHPGVTVKYEMPEWGTIQEKALTLAASNSLPDVQYIHTQFLPD